MGITFYYVNRFLLCNRSIKIQSFSSVLQDYFGEENCITEEIIINLFIYLLAIITLFEFQHKVLLIINSLFSHTHTHTLCICK